MEINRIPLLKGWKFALTEDRNAVLPEYDDAAFRSLSIPHDWQIENERRPDAPGGGSQGFYPREQMGVYRLRFSCPEDLKGKSVRVLFDGVQRFSSVYINGVFIGGRPYGYVPFLLDLTDHIKFSEENLLAVIVDNLNLNNEQIAGGDRWYSGAGIYRKVWLLIGSDTRIVHDGIRITSVPVISGPSGDVPDVNGIRCESAEISIAIELEGSYEGKTVAGEIFDPSHQSVHTFEIPAENVSKHAFSLLNPLLWSPDFPKLYTCELSLGDDRHSVRFGIRSAVFDHEDGFLLNGEKTKLWGANLHHDGMISGAAVPIEVFRRRLTSLKKMGVNTIRASHNPMAEEMYDLLDEMGFLVIDELYDKWRGSGMYYDRLYDEWHLKDAETMVRRSANHPSVILWSVGNEVSGQYSEDYFKCLKALTDKVHALDPTRSVTCALISFVLHDYNDMTPLGKRIDAVMKYASIVDVVSCNYMEHFYEKLREAGMRKPIIGTEVRTYYLLDEKYMNHTQIKLESPYAIVKKYDWVAGAILWAGVDYLGESSMWPQRGWTGNPLDSTADWKNRAWYVASQFKNEPVLKVCVYDESEPWDGARGLWGFPQMRSHWKYHQFEKVFHVAVMTNCDMVKLYQNSQTVRVGYLKDFPDGMIHFYLPYAPGVLRAEGYRGGLMVKEDILYSDHNPDVLRIVQDKETLKTGGEDVMFIDLLLEDKHGRRYVLENPTVDIAVTGKPVKILTDNGDAFSLLPFDALHIPMFNGHLMLLVRSGEETGETKIRLTADGFEPRVVSIKQI
ncbi:MAG: DUF4982 domain-containing protein [Clostridia bacterium]|nr:DUF4982 domain-containing protein [Clostridia bacterium]